MISSTFNPNQIPLHEHCPEHVIQDALDSDRKVIKIEWAGKEYPKHLRGFIQWSTRPYTVTDTCDGTRDCNAQLVLHHFCQQTDLSITQVFSEAYPNEQRLTDHDIEHLFQYAEHTIIPECNNQNKALLLKSLYSMNFRSLVTVLEEKWEIEQAE